MTLEQVAGVFALAGIPVTKFHELQNKYWNTYPAPTGPWWLAMTPYGPIEIGWRKRVISIDWTDTKARVIVTEDQVTKDETCVHAYTYAKCVEYLTKLKYEFNKLDSSKENTNG
jgi:hypothetical protein